MNGIVHATFNNFPTSKKLKSLRINKRVATCSHAAKIDRTLTLQRFCACHCPAQTTLEGKIIAHHNDVIGKCVTTHDSSPNKLFVD